MANPEDKDKLYSVGKTFIWFALAGMILTISLVAMVAQDYTREWKGWQRQFLRLKYEKTQQELKAVQQKIDKQKLEELQRQYADAEKNFKSKKPEYRKLAKEISKLDAEINKVQLEYQTLKQYQDSYKYYVEEYTLHHDGRAKEYEGKLKEIIPKVDSLRIRMEELEKSKEEKQKEVETLKMDEGAVRKEMEKLTAEVDRAKRKLETARINWAKIILDAPMLDFLRPTLQIQQAVLEDLHDDYHFAKVQKVDRCTTCHLGIDQKEFEDIPQPFRTHSKIDLMVGSTSPHPLEKFGCTVCHGGNGHSLTFKDAAHAPQNEKQAKEWEKKYHWHPLEKWAAKMLPLDHAEASCAKCHKGGVHVPQAEKLNEGHQLVQAFGCFGCHKIEGMENLWKVGPGLEHVGTKLEKEWIIKWLQDPKAFRPTTKMPRVFHLSNTSSPKDKEKNDAAIEGITTYLLKHSTPVELSQLRKSGDPKAGEKIFKDKGCLGCHSVENFGVSTFAANLSGMGSKTSPEWIYTWIQNPKHYHSKTRMPILRLTEEEATHVTSYLLTLRNPEFEAQTLPQAKPEVIDEMVLGFMRAKMRKEEAQAELAKMDQDARLHYLGERMISHLGCFACHDIDGFQDAKPIGTEFKNEGAKEIERLDFGYVPIERTRHAWFFQKLKEPRIFDQGKIKDYFEKLKMPDFTFTDEQARALTTYLLSKVEEPIPLQMKRGLNLKEEEVEAGRLLVSKLNCQGCHLLDGKGGQIKEVLADAGAAPPPLEGEGAKVQEAWLYEFLKDPTTIRPWLTLHMPTFGFSHEELTTLIKYFSNLAKQDIFFEDIRPDAQPTPTPEELSAGKKLFETFQCAKCHEPKKGAALGASFLAPDLTLSKTRLKPQWIIDWLKDPQALQPGTMMPTFFPEGQSPAPDVLGGDAQKQIEAIQEYLMQYHPAAEEKAEPAEQAKKPKK